MSRFYPNLFSPFTIKNVTFRNRILMAPFLPQNADVDGMPSEYGMAYFEERARGGAAQLTVGETPVDTDRGCRKIGGYLDLTREQYTIRQVCMLSELTMMMHQHQTVAGIELSHIGQWNQPQFIRDGKNPVGPVAFTRPDGVSVDALTEPMMEEIADHFAHAALNAKRFGFDSVMVHGGHGWLQSQFLSPLLNTRTDDYGGCFENRARFPLRILRRVREAVGPDMLIEYRVSAEERIPGGIGLDETIRFLQMAEDLIDLVHVSVGCYQNPVITRTFPSIYEPYGCNAELAAAIKKSVSLPVAVVGVINTPEVAEEILASGKADFVAIAKQLIADPEFPQKAATGRAGDIVPCIRCYRCMGIPGLSPNVVCSVNPMAARESRRGNLETPVRPVRVLVAGGGPGGMKAALTAAQRGHRVTLAEASGRLGGKLSFADCEPVKKDLRRFRDYLIDQVTRHPAIEVKLNTRVTPALLRELKPEAVIAAIGAEPAAPAIDGAADAPWMGVMQAYEKPETVGRRVVIVGGGMTGCELAIHLRNQGRDVTVLHRGAEPAPDCVLFPRMALLEQLKNSIHLELNTAARRLTADGVEAGERFFPADTVVVATGMRALRSEAEALCAEADRGFCIGDCLKPRKVTEAVNEGYFAGMDI